MKTKTAVVKTIEAFEAAGCTVTDSGYGLDVRKGRISMRVQLTPTGAFWKAWRTDVHPNLALTLRTRKDALKVFGVKGQQ